MLLDDAEIMRQVVAGQAELFGELVRRHRPALLKAAASKLAHASEAEDAVQETFLAAFRAKHTFDAQYSFRGWLWTILLNTCCRHARRNRSTGSLRDRVIEPSTTHSGLSDLLAAERTEVLNQLLDRLPDVQADALRLRFFGELQFQEIAQVMRCSVNGAKERVRKGLERLAQLAQQQSSLVHEGDLT